MQNNRDKLNICVIGLGYVGLPLAIAFSKHFNVLGYDNNRKRVNTLKKRSHRTGMQLSSDPQIMKEADFIIITVPTPVNKSKQPDLSFIVTAAKTVSRYLKPGCTVILESTVYPGVTEEIIKPILEKSGYLCGRDFKIAYCPERINPGDRKHTIGRITKVVSGMDEETTEAVANLYSNISPRVFKAKSIKTAEAAKSIENIQRDLNIALVNELSLIFERIGIDTKDILEAAATKWNFHSYSPGLVGGHCIPVDPYYLVYKSEELGYHPQVILAGRAINDYMPTQIAYMVIKALNRADKRIKDSRVLIMGLTYKENVADTRETPVMGLIKALKEYGVKIFGLDPILNGINKQFEIEAINNLEEARNLDCVILAVVHDQFKNITLDDLKRVMNHNPILIDVRGYHNKQKAQTMGFDYLTL